MLYLKTPKINYWANCYGFYYNFLLEILLPKLLSSFKYLIAFHAQVITGK